MGGHLGDHKVSNGFSQPDSET